ncbi:MULTISPECIES: hypothetical protein [Citrobacter]|uniref:hypothetical protein n=1 Tax=Citrobacter TaxID=544 RepID=UPI00257CBAE1|nr:hypothetical protein [Citrobacter sp. Ca226]MDM3526775.1 hypothetical protein [Citrobacter sp. Ca226]
MNKLRLFAVLNIDHLMVAWEVAIGRITTITATDANGAPFPTPSLWLYNSIHTGKRQNRYDDFMSEYQIEYFRHQNHQQAPSRLTGAFFFETYEEAVSACKYWEWDSYIDYISEIEFTAFNIGKYDSNWITNKIRACQPPERKNFIDKYFSHDIEPAGPLWEIIADGHGKILNTSLRKKAYNKILEKQPSSTPLLAMAMSCYDSNPQKYANLLRTIPFITKHSGKYIGQFIINMSQFDAEQNDIAEICVKYINRWKTVHIKKIGRPLTIKLPSDKDKFFSILDLRDYNFEIDTEILDGIIKQAVNEGA